MYYSFIFSIDTLVCIIFSAILPLSVVYLCRFLKMKNAKLSDPDTLMVKGFRYDKGMNYIVDEIAN